MKDLSAKILTGRPYWIVSALYLVMAALAANVFLQYRAMNLPFIRERTALFFYGALVLFMVLVLFCAVFGDAVLGSGIFFSCIMLLTFGERCKLEIRHEHVYPADLITALNVSQMISFIDKSKLIWQFGYIVLILAVTVTVSVLIRRVRKRVRNNGMSVQGGVIGLLAKRANGRRAIIARLVIFVLAAALLLGLISNELGKGNFNPAKFQNVTFNQTENYDHNGFVMAFISNIRSSAMTAPPGYSKTAIKKIAEEYKAIAVEQNAGRADFAGLNADIIFVMNESFCDPQRFSGYYPFKTPPGETLTPYLDELKTKAVTGYVFSPTLGGGTANVEFEALTGMSTYFLGTEVPFQNQVSQTRKIPSFADFLKKTNIYTTTGFHPNPGSFYKRNSAYPNLGFDAFHDMYSFRNTAHDRTSEHISDASAYAEAEQYLDDYAETDFSLDGIHNHFLMVVTMQNHPPYGEQYISHSFHVQTGDMQERLAINDYMEMLHSSDAALAGLIDWIDQREKRTILVFWGDHLPGFYAELPTELRYETPFVIYDNFGEGMSDAGVLSCNYIATALLDYLNVKKSPYYYMLDALRAQYPIFSTPYFSDYPPQESALLNDYRMLEYDVLEGKQYALAEGLFDLRFDIP